MRKIDWNKAMTRKDYAILCGVGVGVGMAIAAIQLLVTYGYLIKELGAEKITWIRKKIFG